MTQKTGTVHRHDIVVFLGALALFLVVAVEVVSSRGLSWDDAVARLIRDRLGAPPEGEDHVVTLAAHVGIAITGCIAAALFLLRRRRAAVLWLFAVGGAVVLDPALKELFKRPEISGRGDYSFPSGSAMVSMAILASLVLTLPVGRVAVGAVGLLAVAAYGAAVVHLSWHYPSDVIAGWCAALAWASGLRLLLMRIRPPIGNGRPGDESDVPGPSASP